MNDKYIKWLENEINEAKRWVALYKEGYNDCCGEDRYCQGLADAYEWAITKYRRICNDD